MTQKWSDEEDDETMKKLAFYHWDFSDGRGEGGSSSQKGAAKA